MIPFSPPRIDDKICEAVVDALKSGWITTGPRTKEFENKLTEYCGNKKTLCLNSATAGLELMLRWFGVKEGDEVIIPAYTYSATANVVIHCGAKPVFVDVNFDDFNLDVSLLSDYITDKTKVIIPVDFGGMPCHYKVINELVEVYKDKFVPANEVQKKLGRIMVLSDAAHSLGASLRGNKAGSLTDVSVFSFHAVKNLTTAEGGAIALNFDENLFDNNEIYNELCIKSLHGQNKDALAKTQKGSWRYDVTEAGYKCNMTDISASIGLVELARYENDTLVKRKHIANLYHTLLKDVPKIELPIFQDSIRESSYHLYPLRIRGISEQQRDAIIQEIFDRDVSVNVHFLPVPAMSFYANLGYKVTDYKTAYDNYCREISLPLYYNLTDEQVQTVARAVIESIQKVLNS
ncbi:MAG: DegT/DnrJ/EryC1/StrS aminotransferase family protein [Sphingobacteriaceae bacterium]|nr:DegT/DnrJ/EryC1/StrS aminotransferase family protein [Sphingobacteriaceae bacterium]